MITLPIMQKLNFAWLKRCFSDNVATDPKERLIRAYEELCELCQEEEVPLDLLIAQVEHTYSRPVGERIQEVGGVMVCLLAYAEARGIDLTAAWELEFNRINDPDTIVKIRAKHAAKVNKTETNRKGVVDIDAAEAEA